MVWTTTFALFVLTTDPIGFVWRATQRRSDSLEFWLLTSSDVLGGLAFEANGQLIPPRGVGSGRRLDDGSALPCLSGAAHRRRQGRTSPLAPDEPDEFPPSVLLGLGGRERCAEPAPVRSADCPSRQISTHGPANVAGLWTAAPPRFAPPSLDHVLAGYAFALEHEVLAEGRCGRLISGLRSAVQSLLGGPEGCHRRPDESRFRPMQPRHGATPLFVGDFTPDVRSGPRPKLCARTGAYCHEQEIADRRPFCPRGDHPADCELTLQRWRSGDVVFNVGNARAEIGGEHVAPWDPNRVDRPGAKVDRDRPSPGLRTHQLAFAADAVTVVEQFDRRSLRARRQTGGTDR